MRRLVLIAPIVALLVIAANIGRSSAQVPTSACFQPPYNTLVSCDPTAVATAVRPLILPNKVLAVTSSFNEGFDTTRYDLGITSQFVCFTQHEPIDVYTIGQSAAAVLQPLVPLAGTPVTTSSLAFAPGNTTQFVVVTPDTSGKAALSLEVFRPAVNFQGLSVRATWPNENVTREIQIVPRTIPTAPAGVPTATATPVPTAAAAKPGPTSTPAPTPFPLSACVNPNPIPNGQSATLYASTTPGATCSATVVYQNGRGEPTLNGAPQTVLSDGLAVFPFSPTVGQEFGTARVFCTLNGFNETASVTFIALPPPGVPGQGVSPAVVVPCKPSVGGVQPGVTVSPTSVPQGSDFQITGCLFVSGSGVPDVPMTATTYYVNGTKASCTATTDVNGVAVCTQNTDSAPVGFQATVAAQFLYQGIVYTAYTKFVVTAPPTPTPTSGP